MKQHIYIGIETSCDETSMSLVKNGQILSHVTYSSSDVQSTFGGVVPEVASRKHLEAIHEVFMKTVKEANLKPQDITNIVYTSHPGLIGCLHVGILFAKLLAKLIKADIKGVNHLYGHIFSAFIDQEANFEFPFLGLVVSGGHTSTYLVNSFTDIKALNETKDDAIGEVYDKVARKLGWEYPGGPKIDNAYDENKTSINFLKNNMYKYEFSYSGLKTSVINYIHNKTQKNIEFDKLEVASSFQKQIIDDLIKKVNIDLSEHKLNKVVLGGGVSANKYLRSKIIEISDKSNIPLLKYTGDNGAMIAYYGYYRSKYEKQ